MKRSEVCLFYKFERTKRNKVCLFHKFKKWKWSENSAYSRNRQDRSDKNELDRSKTKRCGYLKLLWSPGINFKELIPPAYALVGLYNNPIPARFLAPLDCSKAPQTFTNTGSGYIG
jgi:hypothetical protein